MLFFFLLLLISLFVFLNLGKFLDITKKPQKADIIVSLGGASGCRMKTALDLYKEGFSNSSKFIYTGKDSIGKSYSEKNSRKDYLLKNGVKEKNIIHINRSMITNTMEEVFFIKEYMLKHKYKTVIFVSHPHHSRRISTLANVIANYKDVELKLEVVSCNPSWWHKERYYLDETSIKISISETVKLFYNLLKYSPPLIRHTKYTQKIQNNKWTKALNSLN